MSHEVSVRYAEPRDLGAVGDLTVAAYLADGFVDPGPGYSERLRDAATRATQAELMVAELPDRDDPAGTVTFCPPGSPWGELARDGEAEFRMLAVAPWARRRGVAEALVSACVARAEARGMRAVVLSSMPEQEAAQRIYRRLGFRRTPALDWDPEPGVHLLAFRLDLPHSR